VRRGGAGGGASREAGLVAWLCPDRVNGGSGVRGRGVPRGCVSDYWNSGRWGGATAC
jgi:hypothetical protein